MVVVVVKSYTCCFWLFMSDGQSFSDYSEDRLTYTLEYMSDDSFLMIVFVFTVLIVCVRGHGYGEKTTPNSPLVTWLKQNTMGRPTATSHNRHWHAQ